MAIPLTEFNICQALCLLIFIISIIREVFVAPFFLKRQLTKEALLTETTFYTTATVYLLKQMMFVVVTPSFYAAGVYGS